VNILAFDTATSSTAVALQRDDAVSELRDDPPAGERPGHATRLLPMAHELLDAAGLAWEEVDLVAVGTGPGGFTGLRVGIATARGVAVSLGVMVAGRSSLAALARAALRESQAPRALALIDARRGEIFAQSFTGAGAEPEAIGGPRAVKPGDLEEPEPGTIVVGDGLLRYLDELAFDGALIEPRDSPLHRVQAGQIAAMATYGTLPAQVSPEYVREPDAKAAAG
jgi:tRNA threonylcarbamoyladenosine biosynthesis protein TsaB